MTRTYHQGNDVQIVGDDQPAEVSDLVELLDDDTAMLAVAYPNFLGQIEDFTGLAEKVHEAGALLVFVANPLALALLKSPGELGADIVVGEGQPLGIPLSYGGPYVGFFATKMAQIRRIAGRIVGETVDADGNKAYVMTLRPREQDIRREKATSNICTNQGLMALAATVYMELLGKSGLRQVTELCWHKSHYAADQIDKLDGYSVERSQPFFNEFVVTCPVPVQQINDRLLLSGIIGGYDLSSDYPDRPNQMLVCVTEMNGKAEIDELVAVLGGVLTNGVQA